MYVDFFSGERVGVFEVFFAYLEFYFTIQVHLTNYGAFMNYSVKVSPTKQTGLRCR